MSGGAPFFATCVFVYNTKDVPLSSVQLNIPCNKKFSYAKACFPYLTETLKSKFGLAIKMHPVKIFT